VRHAATGALREFTSLGQRPQQTEKEDYSETMYDEWSGYGGSLFNKGAGGAAAGDDAEDNEADTVFMKVDEFMDTRRKRRREEKVK
jgi:pre-mRNA-processing factor 6